MDQTIIGVLFVSAVAAAIAAILDAVNQRAEKAVVTKRCKELEFQLIASDNERENLKKILHNYSSVDNEKQQKFILEQKQLVDRLNNDIEHDD